MSELHDDEQLTPSVPATPDSGRLDAALRRTVAELVLATTSEGVWLIDASSRTTFVNRHTAAMLGYEIEEMIGVPVFSFMDEEWRPICERNLNQRRRGIAGQVEFKLRRKDGDPLWVLLTSNPLHDRQGRYAGALAMLMDITARKHVDFELRRAYEDLECVVQERTRGLVEGNQRLLELTYRDELTGLYNRRYLRERLAQEAARAQRHSSRFSLLFIDLDRFKTYNDRFGHQRGDEVLRRFGRMLVGGSDDARRGVLRVSDVAARWGGEELLVFAPETSVDGASILSERLREEATRSLQPDGPDTADGATVTLSIGIASWGVHGTEIDELIRKADDAMYAAKRAGRNAVRVATVSPAT